MKSPGLYPAGFKYPCTNTIACRKIGVILASFRSLLSVILVKGLFPFALGQSSR